MPSPLRSGGLWFGPDAVICRLCPLVQFAVRVGRFSNHPHVTQFRLFLGCGVIVEKTTSAKCAAFQVSEVYDL